MNEAKTSGGNCAVSVPRELSDTAKQALAEAGKPRAPEPDDFSVEKPDIERNLRALLFEREAEIERLTAALALSQSQNYCTLCGNTLDGYRAPLEPTP